jgi:hypothetical protein
VLIWNRLTESFIGAYSSELKSIGLSVDGNDLITLSSSTSSLTLLKLCADDTHIYNSDYDSC